jgi:hypothetical protein
VAGPRRGSIIAVALVLAVAACGFGPQVAIRTARVPSQACDDALISGVLATHPASGLGIAAPDGTATPVEWPFGWSARNEAGRVALLDATGKVVAREGDRVTVGGGLGAEDVWFACGPLSVVGS